MSRAMFGQWLSEERQARGWSVPQMRHRLRQAAGEAGDTLPSNDCLSVMIHRWEDDRSGISERYRLHYCRAFRISIDQFGQADLPRDQASLPLEHDHLSGNPASTPAEPTSARVDLAADVQSAIHAACNRAVRGILADVIGHLGRSLASDAGRQSAV